MTGDPPAGPRVVLCADDFAMTEGVSRGILELISLGRLSATSVMTNASAWREVAPDLRSRDGRIGIGLHLTFTAGKPLGPMPRLAPGGTLPPLGPLLREAVLRRLPGEELAAEIQRQLEAFQAEMGRWPDFLDGHQHVHALPAVRDAVLAVLGRLGLAGRLWLRDPADSLGRLAQRRRSLGKALMVKVLAAGFARQARAAGFRLNEGFSGFSAFDPEADLGAEFAGFLTALGPRPLVMCHPGHVDDWAGLDEVVEARAREWAYLGSDAFGALLAERRIALVPAP